MRGVEPDPVAAARARGSSRSACLAPSSAGRCAMSSSCSSGRWPRGSGRGRARAGAEAGASGASRSTDGPRATRPARPRSGSRCSRLPPRARARPGALAGAVRAAVQLDHVAVELPAMAGTQRHLERPGGDHHLVGPVAPVVQLDHVAAVRSAEGAHPAVQLDRQVEVAGIVGQVGRPRRRGAGSCPDRRGTSARAGRVARGREQLQRVPAGRATRPPARPAASRIVKRRPCRARKCPMARPAWPPPMTITS